PGAAVVGTGTGVDPLAVRAERLVDDAFVHRTLGLGDGLVLREGAGGEAEDAPEEGRRHHEPTCAPPRHHRTSFPGRPAPARSQPSRLPGRQTPGTYSLERAVSPRGNRPQNSRRGGACQRARRTPHRGARSVLDEAVLPGLGLPRLDVHVPAFRLLAVG